MIPTNSGKYSCANGTVVTWLRRICLRLPTIPPGAQHVTTHTNEDKQILCFPENKTGSYTYIQS